MTEELRIAIEADKQQHLRWLRMDKECGILSPEIIDQFIAEVPGNDLPPLANIGYGSLVPSNPCLEKEARREYRRLMQL